LDTLVVQQYEVRDGARITSQCYTEKGGRFLDEDEERQQQGVGVLRSEGVVAKKRRRYVICDKE
jgi:hypothetical protein